MEKEHLESTEIDLKSSSIQGEKSSYPEMDLENFMRNMDTDKVECPIRDTFTPGLYTRECTIPKGTFLVSKRHGTEHPYVISKGKVSVYTEKDGWVLYEAPYSGVTLPDTKRILYAHEETIWTTFHPTDKTTVEEVEADIIINEDHLINK